MSKSTGYVRNSEDVQKYLSTMIDHAEKHGIKIMGLVAKMPMLDLSVSGLTQHGKNDLDECKTLTNNLQFQIVAQLAKKKNEENVRKIDDFLDDLLGGDDDGED